MRGWYSIYTFQAEKEPDFEAIKWCLKENESMALVIFDIGHFRQEPLNETVLLRLMHILKFFAVHAKDVILRPVYDREGNGRLHEPEKFDLVLMHLRQIGEKLKEDACSVIIFQGLLIGAWGEMHDSAYLSERHLVQLSQSILPYLDENIYLAVRTPAQWRQIVDEKTFQYQERVFIGLFDDGIFGSISHLGTFGMCTKEAAGWQNQWMREEELLFENTVCMKSPCGGEVLTSQDGKIWHPEEMIREMRLMHLSYLNSQHDAERLKEWQKMIWQERSFYDYVSEHLGYAFRILFVDIRLYRGIRKKLQLVLEIENEGFSVCFQETEACLIIETQNEKKNVPVSLDLRQWMPGEKKQIKFDLPVVEGEIYLSVKRKRDHRLIFFHGQDDLAIDLGSLKCP